MTSLINPSNIDGTYPIAGQDNDSQGFRDNFTNIKNNLTTAQGEITDLQGKAILKSALSNTALDNNMLYTQIKHPQLAGYSETLNSIGSQNGSTTQPMNYDLANFHKITSGGSVTLSFQNWPAAGQVGRMELWFHCSNVAHQLVLPSSCTVGFPSLLAGAVINGDQTVTITFPQPGDYFYNFLTVDSGTSVYAKQV